MLLLLLIFGDIFKTRNMHLIPTQGRGVYLIRSLQPAGRGVVPCAFHKDCIPQGVSVVVNNATFNNILVISWWSVLLMEENGVPGENH